ncbi:zinc finger matrin-type protein 5 [Neodiprion pinetum]|uniref:Zinc finger matrin-type protein 5 n=1 Tax=Neodiprion lecontei TaxID=441921 RepID=A0A6J0BUM4_NEOLC|nr:zinc finger matrin-type protein 5 [Neodiprion lecontei]XP_046491407.1 zinc finger matrin-type protein 5 [Neodiprion pinetum]
MGRRYYCDYCDRSFKDDPEARKKHLSSIQHSRNRTEHYDRFKDAAVILKEESAKTPCKRFITQGDCAFGSGCRFSHYTPHMMWELEQHVLARERQSLQGVDLPPLASEAIDELLEGGTEAGDQVRRSFVPRWNYPVELQSFSNLPPSLWPITPDSITDTNFGKWGF